MYGNPTRLGSGTNQGRRFRALINDKKIYQNVNAGTNAFKGDMEALKHNFFLRGF